MESECRFFPTYATTMQVQSYPLCVKLHSKLEELDVEIRHTNKEHGMVSPMW